MAKASELTKQAQALIGIKEGSAEHKKLVDLYNENKPLPRGYAVKLKDSWCALFASILAILCKATDIIPVECSCEKWIELANKLGIWIENENITPKEGYFILYDWQDSGAGDNKGWSDHIGYVEKVENGIITVIEGNYNDSVKRRTIKVNEKTIRGYAAPKYEAEPAIVESTLDFKVGDYVTFTGSKHYTNANAKNGRACKSGKAKVTAISKNAKHPYHLKKVSGGGSTVYGWVDEKDVSAATKTTSKIEYYPKYTGKSSKINIVLEEIGVPAIYRGKLQNRKPIAAANGIKNYSGTLVQNLKLVSLAKAGKLKRV